MSSNEVARVHVPTWAEMTRNAPPAFAKELKLLFFTEFIKISPTVPEVWRLEEDGGVVYAAMLQDGKVYAVGYPYGPTEELRRKHAACAFEKRMEMIREGVEE